MKKRNSVAIIQLNDSHAYFELHPELFWEGNKEVYRQAGGYARIATLVKQIRAEHKDQVLFCDCGDTMHGTYPAQITHGKAMIPVLNALSIDMMTAHWEFAYGKEVFTQRAAELNYPVLAINVYEKETDRLLFPPYKVMEVRGLRIGVVGIASNIIEKTMPPSYSEGLHFTLGKAELAPIIDVLRVQEKVDLIVLVSHLGFPQDMKLLSEVPGIDVCLSGHTHNRLSKPVVQGKTLVIQSGCHGSFLGLLNLQMEGKRIVDYQHQLLEVTASTTPDPAVNDLIRQALAPYKEELAMVVGKTATGLNRNAMLETTVDNFLLQALLDTTGAELAFSNGWRFGAPVMPGNITINNLYNIIPMNPPVSTVNLTGEEIVAMLEENLERTFAGNPYDQMGGYIKRCMGLSVYMKIENPYGQRIQRVFIGEKEINPSRTYHAAFVTAQGVPSKYGSQRNDHPEHAIDAMKTYLAKHNKYRSEIRGTFVAV